MAKPNSWTVCNTTLEESHIHEDPVFGAVTFHHIGLFLSAIFGLISVVVSLALVFQHATHYLKPREQRHIIRILLMIPIYSIVSFLSYLFYRKAVYWDVLGNCYEAFAIASFFTLMCHYIAPSLHEQKEYFRSLVPINWFWGVFGLQKCTGGRDKGPFRRPRSGLTWFNIVWIGVFQYCFIRIAFTILSVVTEYFGRYCEASLSPVFAHVWVTAFEAVSVSIAMFCLIQFYLQLRQDLAEHKPFLKVLCIKLVIFFSFWQTIIISLISSSSGPLKPTAKLSYQDIKVGIPAVLLCIEMSIFAVMHWFAFNYREYTLEHNKANPITAPGLGFSGGEEMRYQGGWMGVKAIADALNPWDLVKATARGFRWLLVGYKHRERDVSYQAANAGGKSAGTGYNGPRFAGNGEAATELRGSADERERRVSLDPVDGGVDEDDRAGLLKNSAQPGRGPTASPHRRQEADEGTYGGGSDLGAPPPDPPLHPTMSAGSNGFANEETAYHPGFAHAGVHPALREEGVGQWDMWAGAHRPRGSDEDDESSRPPTYRTRDDGTR